jgi:hypothetical protein
MDLASPYRFWSVLEIALCDSDVILTVNMIFSNFNIYCASGSAHHPFILIIRNVPECCITDVEFCKDWASLGFVRLGSYTSSAVCSIYLSSRLYSSRCVCRRRMRTCQHIAFTVLDTYDILLPAGNSDVGVDFLDWYEFRFSISFPNVFEIVLPRFRSSQTWRYTAHMVLRKPPLILIIRTFPVYQLIRGWVLKGLGGIKFVEVRLGHWSIVCRKCIVFDFTLHIAYVVGACAPACLHCLWQRYESDGEVRSGRRRFLDL